MEYTYHEVVQRPIAPPYEEILEKMKSTSLKHSGIAVGYPKHFKPWNDEEAEKERAFEMAANKNNEMDDDDDDKEDKDDNKWSQDLADALPGID